MKIAFEYQKQFADPRDKVVPSSMEESLKNYNMHCPDIVVLLTRLLIKTHKPATLRNTFIRLLPPYKAITRIRNSADQQQVTRSGNKQFLKIRLESYQLYLAGLWTVMLLKRNLYFDFCTVRGKRKQSLQLYPCTHANWGYVLSQYVFWTRYSMSTFAHLMMDANWVRPEIKDMTCNYPKNTKVSVDKE